VWSYLAKYGPLSAAVNLRKMELIFQLHFYGVGFLTEAAMRLFISHYA